MFYTLLNDVVSRKELIMGILALGAMIITTIYGAISTTILSLIIFLLLGINPWYSVIVGLIVVIVSVLYFAYSCSDYK